MNSIYLWMCLFLQVSRTLTLNSRMNVHSPVKNNPDRTGDSSNLIKKVKIESQITENMESTPEMVEAVRQSRGQDIPKHHRSRCNSMSQAWTRGQNAIYSQQPTSVFRFKIFTGPLRPLSPQHNLVRYITRVYKCCKLGFTCNRVRGLQGTLEVGKCMGNKVEFYVDPDVSASSVFRAELHLEVPTADQLTVIPVLTANGKQHFSFIQLKRDHTTDLILDLRFLLQILKEAESGNTMTEKVTVMSLGFHCIQQGYHVPCDMHRISLLHAPFIAFHYK
ncbi:uncharacterized protein RCH25_036953 [Pelodytes ibericus]